MGTYKGFYAQINGIFKSLSPMYFRKYFGIVRRHRCAENVSFLGFANDSDISRQPKGEFYRASREKLEQ